MRYMLVDGHGNFGSVDGDPPAAYRYTEARMSKLSVEMLADIDKETVDFTPNYDDRLKEPTVLPSHFPNLLVNGSTGIAVGMATNIPPHNMGEVIDGMCRLIDHPDATLEELMEEIQGPDFPDRRRHYGSQWDPGGLCDRARQDYRAGADGNRRRKRRTVQNYCDGDSLSGQ